MKKIILSFITFISFFSFSHGFEANVKFGYDFFRDLIEIPTQRGAILRNINYDRGFILGVEVLPFTFINERIKLGVGLEYNLGEQNLKYYRSNNIKKSPKAFYYGMTMIPIYATAKFTYYRPKNIDVNLYTFVRLGYAFAKEFNNSNDVNGSINRNGIYYGFGLGMDYKYFLAEILYDGRYQSEYIEYKDDKNSFSSLKKDFYNKVGVRLGLQLGSQHFNKTQIIKCAKCEPKIIEQIVEVPKVVKKNTTNKIIIKNFDISAEALFGFNKYKLEDLKEGGKQEIEEKVKELLKSGFEITGINVIGHTDRLGKDEYNYKLGLNRAETIKEYLKELGIKVEIKSSSKGKTQPKVHCNNVKSTDKLKECLQPNRRVELQFIGFETEQKVEEVVETSK